MKVFSYYLPAVVDSHGRGGKLAVDIQHAYRSVRISAATAPGE